MARTKVRGSQQLNANFVDLLDTPAAYTSSGEYLLRVNGSLTGVEFADKDAIFPPVQYYNQIWSSDGSTKVFALTVDPIDESMIVTLEGVALSEGGSNDWTVAGSTLTLDAGVELEVGMKIDVTYVGVDTSATTGVLSIGSSPATENVKGLTTALTVDENSVGFGAALHIDDDGNLVMADADATSVIPCHFLATETGTGVKNVLITGFATLDAWDWTPGGPLYVSTTPGTLTQTAPSASGDRVQIVGYAITADTIFFKPDFTDLEIA